MNPIGGYFELELNDSKFQIYEEMTRLNSGRNCLKLVIEDIKPQKIYLPKYTCVVIQESFKDSDIEIEYYSLNEDLLPILGDDFYLSNGEVLLYTNYFGCYMHVVKKLTDRFGHNLIVDNAQAFFEGPLNNLATFYSPRKFFGVPDGGILSYKLKAGYSFEVDKSSNRISHLIKRMESGPEEGYQDFILNDRSLTGEPIKFMSPFTFRLLRSINYQNAEQRRSLNFKMMHRAFEQINELRGLDFNVRAPLCYPLLTRSGNKLKRFMIENRVYIPTYWPSLLNEEELNSFESDLRDRTVCLPVDHRYGEEEMKYIISLVNDFLHH